MRPPIVIVILFCIWTSNPIDSAYSQASYDSGEMLVNAFELSRDRFEGRKAGSEGGKLARAVIIQAFQRLGIEKLGDSFEHDFALGEGDGIGANIIGMVRGSSQPERFMVISAHYDHLGIRDGEIFNGADDNASGTAAVIALAEYFARVYRPHHSLIFALMDAEESGLLGAKEFVANPPVTLDSVVLDVNLDMVSRSAKGELYATGTYHYPFLKSTLARAAQAASDRTGGDVKLLFGHDLPGTGQDDWTMASDHGPFHRAGIPFVYFGVEDHEAYHQASDDFADITPRFYVDAVEVILESIVELDATLGFIASE